MEPRYRRILLKLSGEVLAGQKGYGIDPQVVENLARQIQEVTQLGVQVVVVVVGGNIWRGQVGSQQGMDRATADYMGMLATVINALALQDALEKLGVETRVQTAVEMRQVAEPFIRRRAIRHLEKGRVVIFGAGIGSPYFTTDTTAALRAAEIEAEIMFKGTSADGVYDDDPRQNPEARRFSHITYLDVLQQGLKVLDSTAVSLCMENKIPILVFQLLEPGNIRRAVMGEPIGTLITVD